MPASPSTTRRRLAAKRSLFEIHDHVLLLASRAREAGLEATEVWLGPEEARSVRNGFEADPGLYGRQSDGLEGRKLATFTIRLSYSAGIRVGVTMG